MKGFVQTKAPHEAASSRWNSWFGAVKYHAEHVHLCREFLLAEKSSSQAVANILGQLETEEKFAALLPRFLPYFFPFIMKHLELCIEALALIKKIVQCVASLQLYCSILLNGSLFIHSHY